MNRVSFRDKARVSVYAERRYRGQLQRRLSKRELELVGRILRRIGVSGATVLDIPCGYGRFTGEILACGAGALSADISRDMVLKTRTLRPDERASFIVADASALPLAADSVDVTLTVRLFQHLADPALRVKILSELGRVARRCVIVSFYLAEGLHPLQRLVKKKSRRTHKHIEFMPRCRFRSEAAAAGLELLELFPIRPIFHSQCFALLAPARNKKSGVETPLR